MPKVLLHMEGLIVLLLCLFFYQVGEFSWWLFIILLFVPDFAAIGYLLHVKVGAILYNIVHTYSFSLLILFIGFVSANDTMLAVGIIFTAHIGLDRLCGFGLKYPTLFKDTHLNRL